MCLIGHTQINWKYSVPTYTIYSAAKQDAGPSGTHNTQDYTIHTCSFPVFLLFLLIYIYFENSCVLFWSSIPRLFFWSWFDSQDYTYMSISGVSLVPFWHVIFRKQLCFVLVQYSTSTLLVVIWLMMAVVLLLRVCHLQVFLRRMYVCTDELSPLHYNLCVSTLCLYYSRSSTLPTVRTSPSPTVSAFIVQWHYYGTPSTRSMYILLILVFPFLILKCFERFPPSSLLISRRIWQPSVRLAPTCKQLLQIFTER